jgi:hypothetical protein
MTLLIEQPLDSLRCFSQQATDRCACCGADFSGAESHCSTCQAPLDVSRTIAQRNRATRFVSLLGASGAGKTVYLGMLLDMLSKGTHDLQGVANSTFSVAVQADTITALEHRRFPEKTASEADGWQWVHCELSFRRRRKSLIDLVTPDFSGEAIALEIERPGTYPAIRSVVGQSQALLILCDSIHSSESPLEEDLFAVKLATYVCGLHKTHLRRRAKLNLPVAIVFTKCDGSPEVRVDPEKFAANNLSRMYQYCERHLANYRFFAASVVGSSATLVDERGCRRQVPFHVEPRGLLEPLVWIMNQC